MEVAPTAERRMIMTAKIFAYCLLMAVGITILAVQFIRDKRRQKGGK